MRILLVEDDPFQADGLEQSLATELKHAKIEIMTTEAEFRRSIAAFKKDPPHVVVIDGMLRWSKPSEDAVLPFENTSDYDPKLAGVRCIRLLLAEPETRELPVLLYSVFDPGSIGFGAAQLPPHVEYIRKESDDKLLARHVRSLLAAKGQLTSRGSSRLRQLWDSIDVKVGWLIFKLDLKKILSRR